MYSRLFSRQARSVATRSSKPWTSLKLWTIAGGVTTFSYNVYTYRSEKIQLDVAKNIEVPLEKSVTIDGSIDPIPLEFEESKQANLHADFQLLGYGVRTVTFLRMKVYGIGLYLAKQDIPTARKYAQGKDLADATVSSEVVGKILDEKVRFAARICPTRNTDFTHLKDGLIKSIANHPLAKSAATRELMSEGLGELREVFSGFKGSVPKNHALWIERLANGALSIAYENTKTGEIRPMGETSNPLVGKALFLLYMSGDRPLSPQLKASAADGYQNL